ncbi:hypothetical protein LPJ66_005491 [Kickxella alabastrina]|uniref:Uncharacterized protein n=1 Tax=Kickxella alabastrina TaxID=61397 RepID=A0ACC1IEY8_9FUNG|nr:hypothetical protein LPJ66_005491 [Kickxella alabastrina]
MDTSKPEPTLSERLASLGPTLQSQIIVDLSSWEDRQRNEPARNEPIRNDSSRSKRSSNKRTRLAPLPEIAHTTLVELRKVRHELYAAVDGKGDIAREVTSWAIGVLSVFVSVADLKENSNLNDLPLLPGARAVFQLLVLAVESEFSRIGIEAAEMAFVETVVVETRDQRAIGWLLTQYGSCHKATFPRCLHLYYIAQLPKLIGNGSSPATAAADTTGLAQAINDLAATYPEENIKALNLILGMYRDLVANQTTSGATTLGIAEDDLRRFILFYSLQSHLGKKPMLLNSGDAESAGSMTDDRQWLADAVRFEMRAEFSKFIVYSDDSLTLQPLASAIEVLFGESTRVKKLSDQPLDLSRVIGVFSLISTIVHGSQAHASDRAGTEDDNCDNNSEDVEMKSVSAADSWEWCTTFVDACRTTLLRLISREQELAILHQLPKTVKNMPQPIPNGLHEAVQRGGRTYNNGPIAIPAVTQDEGDSICKSIVGIISTTALAAASVHGDAAATPMPVQQLFQTVCETVPALFEILAVRMESLAMAKSLIRFMIEEWPVRILGFECEGVNASNVLALYRSLLAVGEGHRGVLPQHLLNVFGSALGTNRRPKAARLQHAVDILSAAVSHRSAMDDSPELAQSLDCVKEVIDSLRDVLVASWRHLWNHCFAVKLPAADRLIMQIELVSALTKNLHLTAGAPLIDRETMAECALKELVVVQLALNGQDEDSLDNADCLMGLAKALLDLVTVLTNTASVERVAIERLVRILLLPRSQDDSEQNMLSVFSVGNGEQSAPTDAAQSKQRSDSALVNNQLNLRTLLKGELISAAAGSQKKKSTSRDNEAQTLAMAEQMLWQNAVRPMPKYPRSGMHRHSHNDDSWALVRPKPKYSADTDRSPRYPLLVYSLLSLAQAAPSGMDVLGTLLMEYYADSLPAIPPVMLDQRLGCGRLHLRAIEMELLQDIRQNADFEFLLFEMMRCGTTVDIPAVKQLVSALLVALIVLWNGALAEPAKKRLSDLDFTIRLVSQVVDAGDASDLQSAHHLYKLLPLISGSDVSRILHVCVWRWVVHRMPGAEDESQRLLGHILRKNIVQTAPLFGLFCI